MKRLLISWSKISGCLLTHIIIQYTWIGRLDISLILLTWTQNIFSSFRDKTKTQSVTSHFLNSKNDQTLMFKITTFEKSQIQPRLPPKGIWKITLMVFEKVEIGRLEPKITLMVFKEVEIERLEPKITLMVFEDVQVKTTWASQEHLVA